MTEVFFYVLKEGSRSNRYLFACRLTEKIYMQGRRVMIHTSTSDEQRHMDRLLWTFRQGSFVPHGAADSQQNPNDPVLIGSLDDADDENDVLINLATDVPDRFSRFDRVVEIIDNEEDQKISGRTRFRFYRDRGYPLVTHDIKE